MAVTHSATTRNNLADQVLADIDAGAGAGDLIFQTSGDVEVATLALSDPAGTVTGPTLTFSPINDDASATGGVTTKFVIDADGGANVLSGSVTGTGGGGDIELSSTTIGAGDTVSVTSLTYTAPV